MVSLKTKTFISPNLYIPTLTTGATASLTAVINHNLGTRPSLITVDDVSVYVNTRVLVDLYVSSGNFTNYFTPVVTESSITIEFYRYGVGDVRVKLAALF